MWLSGDRGEVLVMMDGRGALNKRELASEGGREGARERGEGGIKIEETPLRDFLTLHCCPFVAERPNDFASLQRHDIAPR